jgi:histidine triad (HIT) family protein|tara:strand:- start:2985 stop:3344 length:360 start_codon:yes stop_codon:yes gene_type:complete
MKKMADKTLFQKIMTGDIPSDILYEDEYCIVIKDIAPQAPTHLLIIPRKAIPMLANASTDDKSLLGHLLLVATDTAKQLGIEEAFRIVINNGVEAGQTVFHLHLHLLGNKKFLENNLSF